MDPNVVNSWPNGWVSIEEHRDLPEDNAVVPEQTNIVNDIDVEEVEEEGGETIKNVEINPDTGAPKYNYIEKVPKFIKYPKKANFFDYLYTIEDNATRATGILITGKENCPRNNRKKDHRIGERYHFESGVCGESSTPECIGKPRHIIVDNLPGNVKNNEGLIPSIIGDFGAFEPIEIMKSMNGSGTTVNDKCSMKNIEVTQLNPGSKTYRKTEKLCVPDYSLPSKVVKDENIENFVNLNSREPNIDDFLFWVAIVGISGLLICKLR